MNKTLLRPATVRMKVTSSDGREWDSIEDAAKDLGCTQAHVSKSIIKDKPINGLTFTKKEIKVK